MNNMNKTDHDHTPQEERAIREAALDETIEDTFPASDPPSTIPNPHDHDAFDRVQTNTQRPTPDAQKRG